MSLTKVSYSMVTGAPQNVADYGASPSATAAQNATAIQAALTASQNGILVFPPGASVYLIDAILTVPSNCIVDFGGNTIKQANGANLGDAIVKVASGSSNVTVRNGSIDVNVANQTYVATKFNAGRGFGAFSSSDITVENINVFNPYGSMILLDTVIGAKVISCNIDDKNATGHYGVDITNCQDVLVTGCTGEGKSGLTGYGIIARDTCQKIRITENSFKYWQIVCLGDDYITGGGGSSMVYCSIENNTLISPSADTSIHFGQHGQVVNNIIIDSADVGISIDYSRNTVVSGNVIHTTSAAGIAIVGCIDCVIDGNSISNPGSNGSIYYGLRCGIWGPTYAVPGTPVIYPVGNVVSNNMIHDSKSPHTMYNGIDIADDGTNVNFVVGNYILGATNQSLYVPVKTNIGEFELVKAPTLLNSWVDYGSGYAPAGYYKSEDQTVFLQGVVKSGTTGVNIFVLPAGYRPTNDLIFAIQTNSGIGELRIYTTGAVLLNSGGTTYTSLSGVSFPTR